MLRAVAFQICRTHRATGFCSYAENCKFAHGQEELRERPFGEKYKTQPCKNFHQVRRPRP